MIKYLGSKRRLVPVLGAPVRRGAGARTALDLFTGTTRVAQAFKRRGARRHRGRHRALRRGVRAVLRRDRRATPSTVDALERRARATSTRSPGEPGYFTETFCVQSRFFQPDNGARIDAIRDAIERDHAGLAAATRCC